MQYRSINLMSMNDFETFPHCCVQCSNRNRVQGRNPSLLLCPNQQFRERCFRAYLSPKKSFSAQKHLFLSVDVMNKITFFHNFCPLVPLLPDTAETRERKGRKVIISLTFFSLFIQVSNI